MRHIGFIILALAMLSCLGCQKNKQMLSKPHSITQTKAVLDRYASFIVDACDPVKIEKRSFGKEGEKMMLSICSASMEKMEPALTAGEVNQENLVKLIMYYRGLRQ